MFTLFRIFRAFLAINPKTQIFVALILLGVAGVLGYSSVQTSHAHEAALQAGPPEAVKIDVFDKAVHKTRQGEVNIVGQLDLEGLLTYTRKAKTVTTRKTLIPVLEVDHPLARPLAVIELNDADQQFQKLMQLAVGQGAKGPIVKVNGKSISGQAYLSELKKVFAKTYGQYSPNTLFVMPLFGDRNQHMTGGSDFRVIAISLGILAAILGMLAAFRMGRNKMRAKLIEGDAEAGSATVCSAEF